jgi:hypothetical protein
MLAEQYPDAGTKLIQIGRLNIHSDPFIVNTDLLPAPVTLSSIQEAASAIAKTPSVKRALDTFWGEVKDLSATSHDQYASIEGAINSLDLQPADLL